MTFETDCNKAVDSFKTVHGLFLLGPLAAIIALLVVLIIYLLEGRIEIKKK